MRHLLAVSLSLVALAATATSALAADPEGRWRSSTGAAVVITPEVDEVFNVILTPANGSPRLFTARWKPGLEGTQFIYRVGYGDRRTATLNHRDQIVVTGGSGGPATWTFERGGVWSPIAGLWRSSTGNRFQIVPGATREAPFDVVLIDAKNQRIRYAARWVPGLEGVQFRYGSHVATFNVERGDYIGLAGPGRTHWARVDARLPRRFAGRGPAGVGEGG